MKKLTEQINCIICKIHKAREGKKTCSDKCAKIFITNLVKPDLDNHPSLNQMSSSLGKSYLSHARNILISISRRE